MKLFGTLRHFMALYEIYGTLWPFMESCETLWTFLELYAF